MQYRNDGRQLDELRQIQIIPDYIEQPLASVLYKQGKTWVIAAVDFDDSVPKHAKEKSEGWLTAEYSMLPSSTSPRSSREAKRGKQTGRTIEIQRLIGRTLRSIVDLNKIPELSLYIDCDVLQADGGTRTASITAAYIALAMATERLIDFGKITESPLNDTLAAVSCGVVQDFEVLDMNYSEDFMAQVDMNVAITGNGGIVEIQGTAEGIAIPQDRVISLMNLAQKGVAEILEKSKTALAEIDINLPETESK